MWDSDRSVIEAKSWRLASELFRRHPQQLRLIRAHPGGGQYDVWWLLGRDGPGDILLNREGTIQIRERFDGATDVRWEPVTWNQYASATPDRLMVELEQSAGLPSPARAPSTTNSTLVYRCSQPRSPLRSRQSIRSGSSRGSSTHPDMAEGRTSASSTSMPYRRNCSGRGTTT